MATDQEARRRAEALHAAGKTKLEIAAETGVSYTTVLTWLPPDGADPATERLVAETQAAAAGWSREEKRAAAPDLRDAGLSCTQIARALGVHVNTVTRWLPLKIDDPELARLAAQASAQAPGWSIGQKREEAFRLHEAGLSKVAIAQALGVNRNTVVGWFTSATAAADKRRARARKLADDGWSNAAIARELKVSRQYVAQLVGKRSEPAPVDAVMIEAHVKKTTPARLRRIAKRHGLTAGRGPKPGDGSIRHLLDAIADETLVVSDAAG